jgi:Flavodoxin domain
MKVIVVYESHYGNTAAVARAIADGFGPEARVLTTDEAEPATVADADLIIAGAPVMAFNLPSDRMLATLATDTKAPTPPDMSHASMRAWLDTVPAGHGRSAQFETGLRWSPGGATGAIERELERSGFRRLAKPRRFVVKGSYGPLREGELEKAQRWGAQLAAAMAA